MIRSDSLIRALSETDASAYRTLRARAFVEDSASFSESAEDEAHLPIAHFQSLIGSGDEHVTFGSFDEGRLNGFATFKRDKRSKARHKGFLHTMYVEREFRGNGIASRLLAMLVDHARSLQGLEQLHLWVLNPETSAARKLYERAGFVAQGMIVRLTS